ncbi:hypothetical protein PLICRDRAFT_48417 [Plicaturopsis crispa FD-325 SS-3]|nr:hypothetical protein PLICRDRAFT_48417 [Plicaturopsis crispa FD-325 SS-3]
MAKPSKSSGTVPSQNWMALQKTLSSSTSSTTKFSKDISARKRRKVDTDAQIAGPSQPPNRFILPPPAEPTKKNGESVELLQKMVRGEMVYTPTQETPGKFVSMDCEMVGVGIDGIESSLARVSLVNFYGVVLLDEFVRQRERVVDYRTQFSGVREEDMIRAKPFDEVQKQVADILEDRILVGHAVHNDLHALLLSHPWPQTRDTQYFSGKHKLTKTRFPALRNLVKQEMGMVIQSGEHSSVTDARATMAIYRLHRKEWEKGLSTLTPEHRTKRKRPAQSDDDEDTPIPGGGRKGVSSGLSTVIKRKGSSVVTRKGTSTQGDGGKSDWWKELGGTSKGSMSLRSR